MDVAGSSELDELDASQRRALTALLSASVRRASDGGVGIDALVRSAGPDVLRYLPAAAAVHRVSGTVERALDGVDEVPDVVSRALRATREHSSVRHLIMTGALEQIRSAFDAANVSWVVMKGPVLASAFYSGVGDRSYGDLDFVVPGHDFPTAVRVLEELGYRHDIHNWALAEQMLAGAVGMASPIAHADLHWHLHYSRNDRSQFSLRPAEMIERARSVDVSGRAVPTFDAVDTLLTLGFHAARSGGHRLIWLKDLERSIAVDDPDLDELVRRCRRYRCAAPVGLMLERSRVLVGAAVPEGIVTALVPRSLAAVDRWIGRRGAWIRLHERDTPARWVSRSARDSVGSTVATLPERGWRTARRRLRPPPINESDDAQEKDSFLDAVAAASGAA